MPQAGVRRRTQCEAPISPRGRGDCKGGRGAPLSPFTDAVVSCSAKHKVNGISHPTAKNFGDSDATHAAVVFSLKAKIEVAETDESPLEIGEPEKGRRRTEVNRDTTSSFAVPQAGVRRRTQCEAPISPRGRGDCKGGRGAPLSPFTGAVGFMFCQTSSERNIAPNCQTSSERNIALNCQTSSERNFVLRTAPSNSPQTSAHDLCNHTTTPGRMPGCSTAVRAAPKPWCSRGRTGFPR